MKKNEFIETHVEAASFGSPLDAWLKIEDAAGNQLARNDDADGSRDPRLEWKAPTSSNFILAVGSVTHRGGDDHCYRLVLKKVGPDYTATVASSSLVITPGTTNELKIDVKLLRGFTNRLEATLHDLPPGITTTNKDSGKDAVTLRVIAAADAPPFQGPVQVVMTDRTRDEQRVVPIELTTRGETGFRKLLVDQTDQFWLTVRTNVAKPAKPEAKK